MKRLVVKTSGKTFSEKVVEAVLAVPFGKVTTYGRIAKACGGGAMSAQSVTSILGKAAALSEAPIPFHRIVYSDGSVWFDEASEASRRVLYAKEGIILDKKNTIVDFSDKLHDFL